MKHKYLLLIFSCIAGCIHSNATGTVATTPGKPINELAGNVINADTKKPLKEVTVTAYSVTQKEKFVLTDEGGKFDFNELKSGIYKLIFEKDGYRKITKDKIIIKTDETFQMRIEMIEENDFDFMPSPFLFIDTK